MDGERLNNYVILKPDAASRLAGKHEMAVCDIKADEGYYLLDKYMIRNEVHITYRHEEAVNKTFPHCRIYGIKFKKKDTGKVINALADMERDTQLLSYADEYAACCSFLQKIGAKQVGDVKKRPR